jgi:hypothetical protein
MMQTKDDLPERLEAAIKMLKARGGALDLEAVRLIGELKDVADFCVAEHRNLLDLQDEIKEWRDVVDQLSIDKASLVDRASRLEGEIKMLNDDLAFVHKERDELKAKLDAVGPMTRAKAEERFEEMRALKEENVRLEQRVAYEQARFELYIDDASVRGAFVELAEVSDKLAQILGRPLQDEDTPLLLADEVDREMLVLKVQQKITQGIGEQQLKTHQDYCAANHTWKPVAALWQKAEAKHIQEQIEGWQCLDRILGEDGGQ